MQLPPNKNVYFLSDFHLGAPNAVASLQRERLIVQFLDSVKTGAHTIFLVGDMFDFWFEYRKVVPKGYVRLLGKLAELSDNGVQLHFFVGNHDMWVKDYFQKELNIPVYFQPTVFTFNGISFYIGHGDGLGPGDHGYKALKKVFRHPVCQWLFSVFPSALGIGLADYFSVKSRGGEKHREEKFLGEEKEWLLIYSKEVLQKERHNFFVFGHRHLPIDYRISTEARYINLGEWINFQTYAVFDGSDLVLKSFTGKEDKIVKKG
jgi:UDP-2,3-diacylglucosamine hydrolase